MTLICAPIVIDSPDEVAAAGEQAARAQRAGAGMIEWRVDPLIDRHGEAGIEAAIGLVADSALPCVLTCRTIDEGGAYTGDEDRRISLLQAMSRAGTFARYVDVEHAAFARSPDLRTAVRRLIEASQAGGERRTGLILSSHDFAGRPSDLTRRVTDMAGEPDCDVVKIAWRARSIRDNLEAFELLATRVKPMIALCMGEFGLMSRVLAPKFGGLLTFAPAEGGEASAPGQVSIEQLLAYRFDSIGAKTRVYGVVGWPVGHSRSPAYHNAAFEATTFDGVYLPLPVPEEWEHFKASVGALIDDPRLDFCGASVTIPHKQHLVRFVIERDGRVEPLAERSGAANTLIVGDGGSLECANTDSPAARDALVEALKGDLAGRHIAVLGAGGVARAVAGAFVEGGACVSIFNRSAARAQALVDAIEGVCQGRADVLFDAIVNCTPLGMEGGPDPGADAIEVVAPALGTQLGPEMVVFDTVYAPVMTPMLRRAKSADCTLLYGESMFDRQAALQFELWTGRTPPG